GWIERPEGDSFNLYRPPIIKPGDPTKAERWIKHIKKIYPDDITHIIYWLAQRVQQPQVQINHALVLGGEPRIGKATLLWSRMRSPPGTGRRSHRRSYLASSTPL